MESEQEPKRPESLWAYAVDRFHKYDAAGDYEKAQAMALELFDIAPKKQGEILYYLGLTWWRCGEINRAEEYFAVALDFTPKEDPLGIRIFTEKSLLEQARGAWIGPHGSLIGWAGLLEKRKKMVINRSLDRALSNSRGSMWGWESIKAPEFKETPREQSYYAHALDVRGLAGTAAGYFDKAVKDHKLVIEIASKIGDKVAVACAHNNLGLAYYFEARQRPTKRQELLDKAEECFRKRLEEDEDKTSVGHAIVLSNLARVLEAQGREDEAYKVYSGCVTFAKKTNQEILAADAQKHIMRYVLDGKGPQDGY